jgi:hypothetical protein
MPAIDEDILRHLMHRSTDDLHAPAEVTAGIVTHHRRRHVRQRALGIAVTGAAAGTAFGVIASGSAGAIRSTTATHGPAVTTPVLTLTAAQKTLRHLSSVAARSAEPAGRYAVLSEKQDDYQKTSVIDSLTGDIWTYQQGAGVPSELPVARHGSPTEAAFDALPTGPAALRAQLIAQANLQWKQSLAWEKQARAKGRKIEGKIVVSRRAHRAPVFAEPRKPSDSDSVFEQATDMLWNPLVSPALRSALFKVLENTPGVVVNSNAQDATGRPAIEISRVDSVSGLDVATFESPTTASVLESSFTSKAAPGDDGSDLYTSITRTSTFPANPYSS